MSTAAEHTIISLLTEIRDMLSNGAATPAATPPLPPPARTKPSRKDAKAQARQKAHQLLIQSLPGIAAYLKQP